MAEGHVPGTRRTQSASRHMNTAAFLALHQEIVVCNPTSRPLLGTACAAGCTRAAEEIAGFAASALAGIAMLFRSGRAIFDFGDWACRLTRRPVFQAEWDAWGHCFIAAGTTYYGSAAGAHSFGEINESFRDLTAWLGVGEHDSGPEDRHNQAIGRGIGQELLSEPSMVVTVDDIDHWCRQAYLEGRLLIGPDRRTAYTPCLPCFLPPLIQDGRRWLPQRDVGSQSFMQGRAAVLFLELPREADCWVEVVEAGRRGTARGPTERPTRRIEPLPTGFDVAARTYLYDDEPTATIRRAAELDRTRRHPGD